MARWGSLPAVIRAHDQDAGLLASQFDLTFFAQLVDTALQTSSLPRDRNVFVDVGSGCGRLVLASSVLWPELRRVAGVEKVQSLHALALSASEAITIPTGSPQPEFYCSDASDVLQQSGALEEASVLFAYSSTFPSHGNMLSEFSRTCGQCLRVGTRIVVTDKQLQSDNSWGQFQLIDALEGRNAETGGTSIGYIYQVTKSMRGV